MDLSWRGVLQLEPETVHELADLTGANADALSLNSFASVNGGLFRLRGHDLPKTFLDRSGLKYCPICVENNRETQGRTWGRAIWQINPIRACAEHGVVLERLDQAQYPRSPHDFAGRIADHRKRIADKTPTDAGRGASQFARYLSRRLFNKACPECSAWLNELPVDVAARLCENIGALIIHGAARHSQSLEPKQLIAAGAAGFEICQQGPDAVTGVYEAVRRTSSNAKGGFSVDFRDAHDRDFAAVVVADACAAANDEDHSTSLPVLKKIAAVRTVAKLCEVQPILLPKRYSRIYLRDEVTSVIAI